MQGDIFQLESLVAVPKPQPVAAARPTGDSSVAIYNEDDLSHLLYVSNSPHHHHHHHHKHHHHAHEQKSFIHPADNGMVLINTIVEDMESSTPALSDCESCSESSGTDGEGLMTPPLSTFEEFDDGSLEAYRRKGRRNAMAFEDGFEFPIFLGRQDEEEWHVEPKSLPQQPIMTSPAAVPVKAAPDVPAKQHVAAIGGPLMSWWPEPMETMENTWDIENMKWELQLEREKLNEREREGGILPSEKTYEGQYDARPVADIEGPLMSWWPEPLETMEYEWSERFYE
ncbi:hypothetical protein F5Y10DRAFT_233911 [Nemania abortiva]|nr:hypothetical protein F5Y10DRAFT_233911 [Nemania abortiva]